MSCKLAVSFQHGKILYGDRVSDLVRKTKARGNLFGKGREMFLCGEAIEGRVNAYGRKGFPILFEAGILKARLGKLSPVFVAIGLVELVDPAWIFP